MTVTRLRFVTRRCGREVLASKPGLNGIVDTSNTDSSCASPASIAPWFQPMPIRRHASGRRQSTAADRGRIVVSGADRASYLQGLLTNDIVALEGGAGVLCRIPDARRAG